MGEDAVYLSMSIRSSQKEMWDWIEEKGYKVSGAPMEVYTGKPKMKGGKQMIKSRIEIPIE